MDTQTNSTHGWELNADNEYTMAITFDINLKDILSHFEELELYSDMVMEEFTTESLYNLLTELLANHDGQQLGDELEKTIYQLECDTEEQQYIDNQRRIYDAVSIEPYKIV